MTLPQGSGDGPRSDLALVLLCAIRYSLGRQSYVPEWTCRVVGDWFPLLERLDQLKLISEVRTGIDDLQREGKDALTILPWERLLARMTG